MRFRVVHKLLSYLLAGVAVGTVATSGSVPPTTLALLALAAALSWSVEPDTAPGRLCERAAPLLTAVAVAVFTLSLYQVVRSFPEPDLSPILNLVLFLVAYKLFQRRSNRDYLQLYILAFLLVLAGAWLGQSLLFIVGFGAYVVLVTWTLTLLHLRHEIEDNYLVKHLPESAVEKVSAARVLNSRRVVGRSFFAATGLLALGVIAGAVLVFALVPRIGFGFLSGAVKRRVAIVGFSDTVKLGQHGVISQDNQTVIVRAQVPRLQAMTDERDRDRAISALYWRGTVYDRYQGGQWQRSYDANTRTGFLGRNEANLGPRGGELVLLDPPEALESPRRSTALRKAEAQEIQVIGLQFPVAFALDRPVAYEILQPPLGSFVKTDVEERWSGEVALRTKRVVGVRLTQPVEFTGGQYIAYSREAPLPGSAVPSAKLAPSALLAYLQVPGSLAPRVRALAQAITKGKTTPAAKVLAVTEWLRTTHGYTTDLKRDPSVPDPLEDFLFHQKTGHCEYFASAAAMLLRLVEVPTRYVNGFLGGEWNGLVGRVTVRDNRAHSWLEAYLDTAGWIRVDATPAGPRVASMSRLRQLLDSAELFWFRWVIEYDAGLQVDLARRIGKQLGFRRSTAANLRLGRPDKQVAFAIAAAVVVALFALRLRHRRRWWRAAGGAGRPRDDAPIFRIYWTALDRLAARGLVRQAAETPHEFVTRLRKLGSPDAAAMAAITAPYAAARYGGHPAADDLVARLARLAERMGSEGARDDRAPPAAAA